MTTPVHCAVWALNGSDIPYQVYWRDLTLAEHRRFRERREHARILFCDIYETCLVQGPILAEVPAGVVAWVAKQQLEQNPFSGKFKLIQKSIIQARERVTSSWFHSARAVVASTFRYTFEEIDTWPPDLFFERVAQAEMLTGVPLEPADPSREAQSESPPGKRPSGQKKPVPPMRR